MDTRKLLKHLIFWMFFIFIAYTLGNKFHWDYSIWYFDMFIHFLGGMWVGMFFLYVFYKHFNATLPVTLILSLVFVFGILWEVFQFYVFNHGGGVPFALLDSASDMFFDMAGGVFAIIYYGSKVMLKGDGRV